MKKILFLAVALIMSVTSAWAGVTSVKTSPQEVGGVQTYYVYTFLNKAAANTYWSAPNGTLNGQCSTATTWFFEATGTDGQYYVGDYATKKYLSYNEVGADKPVTLGTAKSPWKVETDGTYVKICPASNTGFGINCNTNQYMYTAGPSNGRSWWTLTESTEQVVEQTYNVTVTGHTDGRLIFDGNEYANGTTLSATGLTATQLSAKDVTGYTGEVVLSGTDITVEYVNILNASINYTPLTTDCWSEWSGNVPAGITELDATNYTAENLYVIEKTVIVEENGNLQSTFNYLDGNHRIDIVGLEILDGTTVIKHDYHTGYCGGQKSKNVYTVNNIPAGTYTLRYIATKKSNDGSNYNTYGRIDNVFTPAPNKEYTVNISGADGATITYNGNTYSNGETFEAGTVTPEEIIPAEVEGYVATVTIVDNNVNVTYKEYQAREAVVGNDDSVFTPGWYQIQIGNGVSQIHPNSKGYYLAAYPRTVSGNNWGIGLVEDGNDLKTYVYISGSHNAFNIQFNKGGSGTTANIAQYYAGLNCLYATSAPNNLYFIPSTDGTEWRIQGNGTQNWAAWDLGGPAVGSSSNAGYAENYFVFTRINELPEAVAPEVGKSYRIAILKSDGTKMYISGTGVTASVADADVLTVESSGDTEYPFTFVNAEGNYLTSHGVQATATKGNKVIFKGGTLGSAGSSNVTCSEVIKNATYYLTAKERWVNSYKGNILIQESNNTFNNSEAPFMNGSYSSALLLEEVEQETYTIRITGNTSDAKVTYKGKEYADGETFDAIGLQETELTATEITNLDYSITISGTNVNVTYVPALIDVTKTYFILSYDAPTNMYLTMTSTSGNVALSTTDKSEIQFEKMSNGVYAIKGDDKYVGVDSWNAVPATSSFGWTVAKAEDDIYTFYQNTASYTGFLGTDAAKLLTEEAKLYNNKGAADPHSFILVAAKQTCPQCFEIVDADATVCPKCGYDLTPSIEITIGTAGYATIAYEEDLVKPEGVKAYYCIYEGEEGHLTPVEWEKSYLPGCHAYILEGNPGTYSFKVTNDYEEDYPSEDYEALGGLFFENLLYGNFDDDDYDVEDAKADIYCDNIYVFSVAGTPAKPGFYRYVGTTLAAHKAFYATATALVSGFIVDFEGTEGINAVMSATNLKAGYDIQGRRINKVQKGINILSGKKIIK